MGQNNTKRDYTLLNKCQQYQLNLIQNIYHFSSIKISWNQMKIEIYPPLIHWLDHLNQWVQLVGP